MHARALLLTLSLLLATTAAADVDVAATVTRLGGTPFYGQQATFEFVITNQGSERATNIVATIRTPLPAVETSDTHCSPGVHVDELRCVFPALDAHQSFTFTASKRLEGNALAGQFATIEAAASELDSHPENNADSVGFIPVTVDYDITAHIDASEEFNGDGTITWRYHLTNLGFWNADLTAHVEIPDAIELVSFSGAECTRVAGNGVAANCTLPPIAPRNELTFEVTVRYPRQGGVVSTSLSWTWDEIGLTAPPVTSERVYTRTYFVTQTGDSGPGSLRQALLDANHECTWEEVEVPCVIAFALPAPVPESGWFSIRPLTPLPATVAPLLTVDAETQTAATGDTNPLGPEVFIDGSALTTPQGNAFLVQGGLLRLRGLTIGGFPDNGVFAHPQYPYSLVAVRVENCYIGVDPTGTRAVPNNRGIMIVTGNGSVSSSVLGGNRASAFFAWYGHFTLGENRIGVAAASNAPIPNGASGIYLGPYSTGTVMQNIIANHPHFGVAVDPTASVNVFENSIYRNANGAIDLGLDGPTLTRSAPPFGAIAEAPVLTAAFFDGTDTVIEGLVPPPIAGERAQRYLVELFVNTEVDALGFAETEQKIGLATPDDAGHFRLTVTGDFRGRYISAVGQLHWTVFAEYTYVTSSETSRARVVE